MQLARAGDVVEIEVYGRWNNFKGVVLVDSDVYAEIKSSSVSITSHGYAKTSLKGNGKPGQYLHRFIMGNPEGKVVDHINGNRLDNRKVNLRVCEQRENSWNRHNFLAKYKGVHENEYSWIAQITADGIMHHIGSFETQEEAALAYNEKALEIHGEFAKLNVIDTPKEKWISKKKKGYPKGEQSCAAKLTKEKVLEIRNLKATGKYSNQDIGKMYGVDRTTIRDIASRKSWKHI